MLIARHWQLLATIIERRSLLNLATNEGFITNNRGLRTLIVGIDIRQNLSLTFVVINACLRARHGNQDLALQTFWFKLCNLLAAPLTPLFMFDGDGRPDYKRGNQRTGDIPAALTAQFKKLITAFGFHFHVAPGEAEAELAHLNKLGFIDVVITEDSDAIVFGAPCVMRLTGPYVTDATQIYRANAIAAAPLSLDEDGLLLFVLLVGGDYDPGIPNCGPKIAHALGRCGFGRKLRQVISGSRQGIEGRLNIWRAALRSELRTNTSGILDKRHPNVADSIPDDFPNLGIIELYTDPLTSWSSRFTGIPPDTSLWVPREPVVNQVYDFCITYFGWQDVIMDRLKANLWPGVSLQMISSVRGSILPSTRLSDRS
ncbi:PIN domain-like protein [Mycena metata]|uniref:PIN domain-like protein n=1 Tax=Mycena metata TaxID=1033252 RepID=A0AAD7J6Z1_9AGAR|nr:PIN domain-like protein [Mycena metata]